MKCPTGQFLKMWHEVCVIKYELYIRNYHVQIPYNGNNKKKKTLFLLFLVPNIIANELNICLTAYSKQPGKQ